MFFPFIFWRQTTKFDILYMLNIYDNFSMCNKTVTVTDFNVTFCFITTFAVSFLHKKRHLFFCHCLCSKPCLILRPFVPF